MELSSAAAAAAAAVGTISTGSTGPAGAADTAAGPDATGTAGPPHPEPSGAGREAPGGLATDAGRTAPAPADVPPHLPGIAHAWSALRGDPALLERISVVRREGPLPARLPVLELARATVAVCSLAAAELAALRDERAEIAPVRIDDGAVATAFTSERHLRIDGNAPVNFAPLSRFWRTSDGWLRTHANYPHHRARLLAALDISPAGQDGGPEEERALADAIAAELAQRTATEVEEAVYAAGGLAVAVRTPGAWARHPQGAAVAAQPLLGTARLDQAAPLPWPETEGRGPLHGLRVLDLTRVIAGPVATRTLALLGADVLRVDAPQLPESRDAHADTGPGKRSTLLDLSSRTDQATFEQLLSSADVVVTGYRPGALDRFGLAPESLADRRPGLVVAQLNAWGSCGPWRRRRGFDSLVQAATGIAVSEAQQPQPGQQPQAYDGAGQAPGALPAQALDHGTGYLLAAAVLRALTEQRRGRTGSRLVRLALARTASWLLNVLPAESAAHSVSGPHEDLATDGLGYDPSAWLAETDSPLGRLRYALPPVAYEGAATAWSRPPGLPGADAPTW